MGVIFSSSALFKHISNIQQVASERATLGRQDIS